MSSLYIPKNYKSPLSPKETERAIRRIKGHFQAELSAELCLARVTAPLFLPKGTA